MTTLACIQPAYFPWLGYFDMMAAADVFVILDDAQFSKGAWSNRNRIRGEDGPLWLTLPVKAGMVPICDKEIAGIEWATQHERLIRKHYQKSPYLETIVRWMFPSLHAVKARGRLVDVATTTINLMREVLEVKTPMILASNTRSAEKKDDPSVRLAALCEEFSCDRYLSGPSARLYLKKEPFFSRGISVEWHVYDHPTYDQIGRPPFVSHLSSLDAILSVGPRAAQLIGRGLSQADDPQPSERNVARLAI